jgi:hypothetical protein
MSLKLVCWDCNGVGVFCDENPCIRCKGYGWYPSGEGRALLDFIRTFGRLTDKQLDRLGERAAVKDSFRGMEGM